MFRLSIFLNNDDNVFLVDEIWSTDKDALITEGQRRLTLNSQYLGVLTTFAPVSAESIEKSGCET